MKHLGRRTDLKDVVSQEQLTPLILDKQRLYVNASASGTLNLDCSLYSRFVITMSGNTTLNLTNVPAVSAESFAVYISVSNGATAYTVTWPTATPITSGGVAVPSPAANKRQDVALETRNGSSWEIYQGPAT